MTSTRAAAFAGKILNLRETIHRIQNGMLQPACVDLATIIKYFCQVFYDFKDIDNISLYAKEKRDQVELIKTLPNFDYSGLYKCLVQLVDILPLIPQPSNGYEQLCTNLLAVFKCLVPFLDQTNMETMPYLVSTLFMSFPISMHKCILDTLCFNLLPFTIDQQQRTSAKMWQANKQSAQQRESQRKDSSQMIAPGALDTSNQKPFHCIVRIEDSSLETGASDQAPESMELLGRRRTSRRRRLASTSNNSDDQGISLDEGPNETESFEYLSQEGDEDEYALLSVTSILMVSFHHVQEPMHHSQLIECLMKLKSNVFEDLLYVIAYGTTRARCPAVEILFRYWPDICPSQADRKNNQQANGKLKHIVWQPTKCQNKNCNFAALGGPEDEAIKMCLDYKTSIALSGLPPPMLVCLDCVEKIYEQQVRGDQITNIKDNKATMVSSGEDNNEPAKVQAASIGAARAEKPQDCMRAIDDDHCSKFLDLLLPMECVEKACENKKCRSKLDRDRVAIGTCFDIECANYNGKRPIRYCKTCFVSIHEPCEANGYDVTLQNHIRHSSLNLSIMSNEEQVNNFVEAIISLLKEAAPAEKPSKDSERYLRSLMGPMSQFSTDQKDMNAIATEEKQLISQYGIWLMTGLCKSVDRLSDELLGRLLGMLFQWFHFTACLPDDQAGSALEKLKGECIKGWIMEVKIKRLDVFISCLLPHPIDCSKVGGHWEVWPDNAHQIKEGFKRLLCLVPYDIITDEIWDEIMPHWMECFRHEVPENELSELKILLSKVFDPELSPLGFETKQMYNFISSRFEDSSNTNQEQTLYWLQIITMLEIPIPINFLYQMLRSGVKSLAEIRANELNRIKMVTRLNELNERKDRARRRRRHLKRTGSVQQHEHEAGGSGGGGGGGECGAPKRLSGDEAATPTSNDSGGMTEDDEDENDLLDDDDEDEDDDAISVTEDDVLLPNGAEQQQPAQSSSQQPLTRQERQAQARAAFNAKLQQHTSALDAQQIGGVAGALQSLSASPSISTMGQPSQAGAATSTQFLTQQHAPSKSCTSSSLAATLGPTTTGGGHTQPLKSTSGSLSTTNKHEEIGKPKSKKSSKPKLKLNLDSVDDQFGTLSKIDNNLVCYILMMDILLKQLDLQEISSHRGLDGREAQAAIGLLNDIISTPWLGKHTCCDSLPYTSSSSPTTSGQVHSSQQPLTSSGSQNTFSASSMRQTLSSSATGSNQRHTSSSSSTTAQQQHHNQQSRQDVAYSNIHSFSHCAQGFEHEDSYETCVFCEIISTFFQLSMSLVEFFSPVIEVSICEVSQDAANGEFDGKPDYSRIGLDHLGPSPKDQNVEFDFATPEEAAAAAGPPRVHHQQDPTSPFSPSYSGPTLKHEVLGALPKELQLAYNLLVQFHQYQTPDIVSQLLQMIKLISLHSQVLSKAAKAQPQFISWCQHNMLVNKLWSLCQLESSEIARTCVPLLLHCITLPWGVRLFRDLVERDFNSPNWLSRFRAVERVVTIAYFCEPATIKNSTLLQSTMASAFCYVVRCLDDIEAIVAQRALVSLEMMKTSSLKLLLWCLEVQFDYIIIDRSIILRSVFQLYNHLRDRRFLTWEFFLNRFDTIFLEAQIYLQQTGEIPSFTMQDLKNTNTKSEIYQKKIARAKEALQETHHSRSLSARFNVQQQQHKDGGKAAHEADGTNRSAETGGAAEPCEQQYSKQSVAIQQQLHAKAQQLGADLAPKSGSLGSPALKTPPASGGTAVQAKASPMKRVLQHGKSTSSRYQSVAYLTSQSLAKRKNSKFMSNLAMQSVPPLMSSLPDKLHQHLPNSFVDDGSKLNEIAQENHVFGVVHRVCDEDRDTNHSLIFLLMQFFSKPDPSHPQTHKTLNRSHQIVLRHLNILMGYSVARKNFLISASNLRLLPVFNAFLTSLPKVLDFNYSLGTILMDTCLPVLIYCPATDNIQYDQMKRPSYSLWLLNPLMRQSWLMSVMTFLYKYQFNQAHLKEHVNMLIWIIINTLESHMNTSLAEVVIQAPVHPTTSAAAGQPPSSTEHTNSKAKAKAAAAAAAAATAAGTCSADEQVVLVEQQMSPLAKRLGETGEMVPSSHQVKPTMSKAETADNLQTSSRSKFFQRKDTSGGLALAQKAPPAATEAAAGSSKKDKGALEMASSSSCSQALGGNVTSAGGGAVAATTSFLEQTASISAQLNEERLLPIGLQQPGSAHARIRQLTTTSGSASVERLLPIGLPPVQQVSAHLQPLKSMENLATTSTSEQATQTHRPLQGLKGNISQSLIGGSVVKASSHSDSGVPKSPKSKMIREETQAELGKTAAASAAPVVMSSKAARLTGGRFGGGGGGKHSASDTKLFQSTGELPDPIASTATSTASKSSTLGNFVVGGGRKNKFVNKFQPSREYQPKYPYSGASFGGLGGVGEQPPNASGGLPSSSSSAMLSEQLAQVNRHSCVQEFSDRDLSMCLVILETFIHHEPSMAAQMLPNILRLVARYSSASFESWQTGCSNAHLVGGSMFVARQFIRVALHDLMENNIFHQIFTSHFTGYEFYKSMSTALADFSDLNQLAPLSKLFEDLNKQKNLPPLTSLMTILENVATYFECINREGGASGSGGSGSGATVSYSQDTWNTFVTNWENFLRKLILALPRFSGNWSIEQTRSANMAGVRDSAFGASGGNSAGGGGAGGASAGAGGSAGKAEVGGAQVDVASPGGKSAEAGAPGEQQPQVAAGSLGSGGSKQQQQQQQSNQNPSSCSMIMAPIMRIILATTKVAHLASIKTIVDPYSKIISYTVCNSQFKYEHLLEINHNCCRLYTRDREKYLIQRQIAYELVQVLKFRFFILEENLLLLLLFVLQDVGGTLPTKVLTENLKIDKATLTQADSYITNVSECLRQHMGDLLEFITDVHAISRINDNLIGGGGGNSAAGGQFPSSSSSAGPRPTSSINRDSFGGHVKAAISQYLALEISLSNSGDQRTLARYLPWLYNSPSLQQGPREFIDCVSHIRQLSWLILGSLQHSALVRDQHTSSSSTSANLNFAGGSAHGALVLGPGLGSSSGTSGAGGHGGAAITQCQPIPIEKNNNIAEHVQVILAGFAEQSKESVLHMSGLFHAFLLCQLWTMYCENICAQHAPNSEQYQFCQSTLDDFWAKITPGVLRLVGHSRVMSEMVSTHFLQLIESLIESNSSILIRYLPMWNSVFYSYKRRNKSSTMAIRLQKCIEWQPPDLNEPDIEQNRRRFIQWLEKVQYKMSHIEIQSSQAAPMYLS